MDRRQFLRTVGGSVATGAVLSGSASAEGSFTAASTEGTFTYESHAGYGYRLYVPSGDPSGRPLFVMLHGCTQEPDDFATATGMNSLAESEEFVVAYPDQNAFANWADCWNWYYDSNCDRGDGSGAAIADIARHERDRLELDGDRVYLGGFSAGAAFVPNLLVNYPDLYAAGAVHSGVEFDAADSAWGGSWAMATGGPDPYDQAEDAYDRMQANGVVAPTPTVVLQGTDDYTVEPPSGEHAAVQAAKTCELAGNDVAVSDPDETTGTTDGRTWERRQYRDASDRTNVEFWSIEELGHDWSGGSADAVYADPEGPDATTIVWDFCSQWSR